MTRRDFADKVVVITGAAGGLGRAPLLCASGSNVASGVQYQLSLRNDGAQLSFRGFDRCLPHHCGSASMQRYALAHDGRIHACRAHELRT